MNPFTYIGRIIGRIIGSIFRRPVLPIDVPALPASVEHLHVFIDRDAQAAQAVVQTDRERGILSYDEAVKQCRAVARRHADKVILDAAEVAEVEAK